MMTELAGGMNAPDHVNDARIPQTPPLHTMPKQKDSKRQSDQAKGQRQRPPVPNAHVPGPRKKQRSPVPQVAKQKGKYRAPWHNPAHQQRPPAPPSKNIDHINARGVWTSRNRGKHKKNGQRVLRVPPP